MRAATIDYFLFLLIAFLFCTTGATAQDFKKEYGEVQQAYAHLDNFYCELKVNVFTDERSATPMQKMVSVIKKRKNDYWYSMGSTKMLVREGFILYINEDAHQMIYTIRDKKRELVIPNQDAAAMVDTVLKKSDSVIYKGLNGNAKKYIVYSHKGAIIKTELWISQDNHLITKIVYHYNPEKEMAANKVEIDYSAFNLSPQFTEEEFSEKKYASFSKNVLKPAGKYAGYETSVIDQNDIK